MQCAAAAPGGAPLITKGILLLSLNTTAKTHRRNKHKKLSKCHPKLLQGGAHLQAGVLLLEEEELLQGQGEGPHHQEQVALLQDRVALLEVRALLEVTLSRKRKRGTKIRMEIWKRYKTVITV